MNNKIPYELSIWQNEDRFIVSYNGGTTTQTVASLNGLAAGYTVINEYVEEVRVGVIGTSDYSSPITAYGIQLVQSINGENELTFSLPYKYYMEENDQYAINPYVNLVVPSRIVKLRYGYQRDSLGVYLLDTDGNKIPQWYDLVVKSTSESQQENKVSYTCGDAYIDELARNGYSVELDLELENNMGSATSLAEYILNDTDWQVVDDTGVTLSTGQTFASDILKSTNNEVLYKFTLPASTTIQAKVMDDYEYGLESWHKTDPAITITTGATIYISSTCYINQVNPLIFVYRADGDYITDDDGTILNSPNYQVSNNYTYDYTNTLYVDTTYRGNMLQSEAVTKYVAVLDQACYQYDRVECYKSFVAAATDAPARGTPYFTKDSSGAYHLFTGSAFTTGATYYTSEPIEQGYDTATVRYYSYDKTEYPSIATVQELIGNHINFTSTSGWDSSMAECTHEYTETVTETGTTRDYTSCITINFGDTTSRCYNNNIDSCKEKLSLDGQKTVFSVGQTFIAAIKSFDSSQDNITDVKIIGINTYTADQAEQVLATATPITMSVTELPNYKFFRLTAVKSIDYASCIDYWSLKTYFYGTGTVKIKDVLLFNEQYGDDGTTLIVPQLSTYIANLVKTRCYMLRSDYADFMPWVTSVDNVIFQHDLLESELEINNYELVVNTNYEKITSITGSESNYFNLIQDICEVFECWAKYVIEHEDTGRTLYKYTLTSDETPIAGKKYFKCIAAASGYFHDECYQLLPQSELYKANSDMTYHQDWTYYTLDNGVYIDANLGYQFSADKTKFYTSAYNSTTKQMEYTQCTAASVYDVTAAYYTYIVGDLQQVTVKDNFAQHETSFYIVDTTKFSSANTYERQYQKFVGFKQYVGRYNDAGFKYGINLNYITRNVVGDEICTKLYVPDLQTDLNTSGVCSIQDADANFSRETAIYNFQYYINNGLLDSVNFNRDLYGDATGGIAYLTTLRTWNNATFAEIEEAVEIASIIDTLTGLQTKYNDYITNAQTTLREYVEKLAAALGITYDEAYNRAGLSTDNYKIVSYTEGRDEAKKIIETNLIYSENMSYQLTTYTEKYNNIQQKTLNNTARKMGVITEFYKKYSQFIKEGTWSSADYYDSDMYYSDAAQVAATSAFPKIEYDLSAYEVSQLDGYEAYNFAVGDKTYIQDTEFFGYNQNGTPYQEEVIVSEITFNLDNPMENSIKIQNYKTQFQDLFQRITAATESYETNKNAYLVAATTVTSKQNAAALVSAILDNNNARIKNATAQSVVIDERGLTITDELAPIYQLRAIGNGIYLTQDGGSTWYTGITAEGINASAITTGSIDTASIVLRDGQYPTFEWNSNGLNAYYQDSTSGINTNKFVRFDDKGIYGYDGHGSAAVVAAMSDHPSLSTIKANSNFSLTWDGFSFRSEKALDPETGEHTWFSVSSDFSDTIDPIEKYLYDAYTGTATSSLPATPTGYSQWYYEQTSAYVYEISDYQQGMAWDPDTNPALYLRRSGWENKRRVLSAGTADDEGVRTANFCLYSDGSILAHDGKFTGTVYANQVVDDNGNTMFNDNQWNSRYVGSAAVFG